MKTLYIDLTNRFPLQTAGNSVVYHEDLIDKLIYEIGAELAFFAKEQNLSDKTTIITDFNKNQPEEYRNVIESIIKNIYSSLLSEKVPEDINFRFPESYVDWLYYNTNPIYKTIGEKLRSKNGVINLTIKDIYDEYIINNVATKVKELLADSEIQKFTIVDLDNADVQIVKDIEKLRENFQYEDYTGAWVQCELGYAFGSGIGVTMDKAASIPFYIQSANKGNGISANWLGWCYQQGNLGVEKDDVKSFEWYKKSADLGDINGIGNTGFCYETGLGVAQDYEKAVEFYSIVQDSLPWVKHNLANIYYNGNLGNKDFTKAFILYQENAKNTLQSNSQYMTGYMLMNGEGVEKDPEKALEFFILAEKNGNKDAYHLIADLIVNGYGNPTFNIKHAQEYYKLAIKQGGENKIKASNSLVRITDVINKEEFAYMDITEAILSPNVTSIGDYAFKSCSHLTKIVIPESVINIGNGAFKGCSNLKSIVIPNSVKFIGDGAFNECQNLESIEFPDSVEKIDERVCMNCINIKNVKFGKNIKTIPSFAFSNNSNLEEIIFSENIIKIEYGAFKECSKLKEVIFNKNLAILGRDCFENCNSLETVKFSSSIIKMGPGIFKDCSSLKNVEFSNHISDSIKSMTLDDLFDQDEWEDKDFWKTLFTINLDTFKNCIELKSIILPCYFLQIRRGAFSGCINLNKVQLLSLNDEAWKDIELINWDTYLPEEIGGKNIEWLINYCRKNDLEGDNKWISIESNAFEKCERLKNISIPSYFHNIYKKAFSDCKCLQEFTLPQPTERHLLTSYALQGSIFENCPALKVLNLFYWNTQFVNEFFALVKCYFENLLQAVPTITEIKVKKESEEFWKKFFNDLEHNIEIKALITENQSSMEVGDKEINDSKEKTCTNLKKTKEQKGIVSNKKKNFSSNMNSELAHVKSAHVKDEKKNKNDSIFNSKEAEELKAKIKKGFKGWMSKLSDMLDDF